MWLADYTVLDICDDKRGEVFRSVFPEQGLVPDSVKTAMPLEQLPKLADHHFALVFQNEGQTYRKYAHPDAGHTKLSTIYFFNKGYQLPTEAQKIAAAGLVEACRTYAVPLAPELYKIASGTHVLLGPGDVQPVTKIATSLQLGQLPAFGAPFDPAWGNTDPIGAMYLSRERMPPQAQELTQIRPDKKGIILNRPPSDVQKMHPRLSDVEAKALSRAKLRHELTHALRDRAGKMERYGKPGVRGVLTTMREEALAYGKELGSLDKHPQLQTQVAQGTGPNFFTSLRAAHAPQGGVRKALLSGSLKPLATRLGLLKNAGLMSAVGGKLKSMATPTPMGVLGAGMTAMGVYGTGKQVYDNVKSLAGTQGNQIRSFGSYG